MSKLIARSFRLPDIEAVVKLGASIASLLARGDVILLRGDLGAGKTELARAVVRARSGFAVEVPSPTFTIVQTYDARGLQIAHVDLYRVEHVGELAELGLDDAMDDGAILVEWPDRAEGLWPERRLEIALSIEGLGPVRIAQVAGYGDWSNRLTKLTEGGA